MLFFCISADACIAAKVANTMALKSVDVESLKRQITTTKNIPQVCDYLIEEYCRQCTLFLGED